MSRNSMSAINAAHAGETKDVYRIVRVILFPPIFAFFNFFSIWFYGRSWILLPFPELYECFALVAMFYLLVLYVSPHDSSREHHFQNLQRLHKFGGGKRRGTPKHDRGSLRWFRVCPP